jgi:hypothetical protein
MKGISSVFTKIAIQIWLKESVSSVIKYKIADLNVSHVIKFTVFFAEMLNLVRKYAQHLSIPWKKLIIKVFFVINVGSNLITCGS